MLRNPNLRGYTRLPRSAFEPVKITAILQCAVICDPFLPIDAVLYYMAHREAFRPQEYTIPGASNLRYSISARALPLARCEEHGPQWYYAASFAQWPEVVADGSDHWNKRFDVGLSDMVDFKGRSESVVIGSGPYKAYHMPVFYRHALEVWWYAMGEPNAIRRLLSCCTHLGKKTSQGWGSVLDWRIEPHPEDWSVHGTAGQLMRAIPCETGVLTGFRPSYWLRDNQTICAVPHNNKCARYV